MDKMQLIAMVQAYSGIGIGLMIGLGMLGILFALVAWYLTRRGRTPSARWVKAIAAVAVLFPLLGASAGWVFTEMGRQPWVVATNPTGYPNLHLTIRQVARNCGSF